VRQIGVNQFVGEHPAIVEAMNEISMEIEKSKKHQQELFNKMTPANRFFHLLKEKLEKPRIWTVDIAHPFWKFEDDTLLEIFPDEELPDIENATDFIVHLNLLYVCDLARGKGQGRRAMELLKQTAEESGSVLTLVASPFGFAPNGSTNPFSRNTWEELWSIISDEDWTIVYLPEVEKELMTFFYKTSGLTNICLAKETDVDDDGHPNREAKNHFCYLPSTLKQKHKDKLAYRLNIDLCSFCKTDN
jgi:GNAT superfamily N-acetyltransferase